MRIGGGRASHDLPDFSRDRPEAGRRPFRNRVGAVLIGLPLALIAPGAAPAKAEQPYRVIDGRVDAGTYNGFRRYNAVCNHCHGADGAGGSFGPSLIATPLPFDEFRSAVLAGRGQGPFVMKGYAGDPNVEPYIQDIYAYLLARADGAIGRGRPPPIEQR